MDAIFKRRSVRRYRKETIPETDVEMLLKAAMRAPSAANQQPWAFVVIRNRDAMIGINGWHEYAEMLQEADCAIIVCGDVNKNILPWEYWIQDCSAATQNLLIEAVYLGIGAVWLGVHPIPERVKACQEQFGLPSNIIPLCVVALGYPAEEPEPIDTYKSERVRLDKW
jgi:nitroreductase